MAIATMTMLEANKALNGILFDPLPYYEYDTLQQKLFDEFSNREIAFETPQYFKVKLNHYLRLRVDNYNKMLQSEMMEIDPFVTDYMVTKGTSDTTSTSKTDRDFKGVEKTRGRSSESLTQNETGNNTTDTTSEHKGQNVDTTVGGKLYSEARNTSQEEKTDATENMNEKQDFSENETTDTDTTVDKTVNRDITDTQTDRKWTETGSSQAHNLNVGSDTPQAMLFNEPNHYYGTGRAHDYGVVVKDSQGNDVYQHYPETDPSKIDSGSYAIGGGDTPWFNYASTAANQTGHDSYDKSGTETYAKANNEKETSNETGNENKTRNLEGDKTITRDTETNTTRTLQEGVATNSNEHAKQDSKSEEYTTDKGNSTTDTTKDTTKSTKATNSGSTVTDENTRSRTEMGVANKTGEVKKGRMMQSPSKLLKEYRETLTFNADLWLISELQPLFLGLF